MLDDNREPTELADKLFKERLPQVRQKARIVIKKAPETADCGRSPSLPFIS